VATDGARLPCGDDERAQRAVRGDSAALGELWRAHRRWLGSVLLAHGAGPGELEDLLQEVALTMTAEIHTLEEPRALRGWLRAVAVNVQRQSARRAVGAPVAHEVPDAERADPAAERALRGRLERSELEHTLRLLDELPLGWREPLMMRSLGGLSQREIAAGLGLSETAVETRLARARRRLREALARSATPSAPGPRATALGPSGESAGGAGSWPRRSRA